MDNPGKSPQKTPPWEVLSPSVRLALPKGFGQGKPTMFIGVEIGGTKLQLVAGRAGSGMVERIRLSVAREAGGEGIRSQMAIHLPHLVERHRPQAIGVGFGGPVDWRTGRICCSHQIAGWHDFQLGDWFREQTNLPVFIDNDANVAALGEAWHGAGRGASPVFWINMGSGVGGGLVVGGRLYHGATPGEAEIGHVCLDRSGTRVEDRCSGWAMDARILEAVATAPESDLARRVQTQPGPASRHLGPAVAAGDPLARHLLEELADSLAFALSHVVQLLHPEIVVIGGGLSLVGEPLRQAVAAQLPRYVMDSFRPGPRIALAGLGEDSVPVGALTLAEQFFPGLAPDESRR